MCSNIFSKTGCILSIFLAAGCDQASTLKPEQQIGANPVLPEPKKFLVPPVEVPKGMGWPRDLMPVVADDIKIEKIADNLLHPRTVYVLPNNDVLVVEGNSPGQEKVTAPKQLIAAVIKNRAGKGGQGGNRISLLRKVGNSWKRFNFLENLNSPFGVQLIGNFLYVANADYLVRYPYVMGETSIKEPAQEVSDLPNTINHHWTKALLASPDGSTLYVGVGSNSNITENGLDVEYRRASILAVDINTGASRIYASGIRNPTGLAWEPVSGKLWAVANERDEVGNDLVPDYMTSIKPGGFYGWPWSYFGQHVDKRVKPERPDKVAQALKPDYALGSHVAPLGILFSTKNNLPEKYHGGAFVSEHGSWGRIPINGYKISFIKFKNGVPIGQPKTVVSGFVSRDHKYLYGSPVGLAQDKNGEIIFADDVGNSVWMIGSK